MYYGENQARSVSVLASASQEHDSEDDLAGIIPGTRGRLRLILSRCGSWVPPADGDTITLKDSDGDEMGTFGILGHTDDPTGTVRTLIYGEESA
jgi:hypothetical protein